jgi:short-subunit dehydrogenase
LIFFFEERGSAFTIKGITDTPEIYLKKNGMKAFNDKVIVLTGAAGGFGQEFIKQLFQLGGRLILSTTSLSKIKKIQDEIIKSIPGSPGKIIGVIETDLSTRSGCEKLYRESVKISHDIDFLINNAGAMIYGDFKDIPIDKWDAQMSLNLMAPMYLTHLFAQDMIKRKSGQIAIVNSLGGIYPTSQSATYAASKFGLRGFGLTVGKELKKFGVAMTVIYPGWARTPLLQSAVYGDDDAAKLPRFLTYSSEQVVKASIRGISAKKFQVYPGFMVKCLVFISRFIPTMVVKQGK